MIERSSQRNKRALKFGVVAVAAIVVFAFAADGIESWGRVRESLGAARAELKLTNLSKAKQEGLLTIVPKFEMPQKQEVQKFLFRDKFNEQLKKAGIKSQPLQDSIGKSPQAGYGLLCLEYRGKCKFEQALDLLAELKDNPYLVGIEELKIQCDPKKREEVELNLKVSTFVKAVR